MKPIEIVELINNSNPALLGAMPSNQAAKIVKEVLVQLGKQIDGMGEDDLLVLPGLGKFRVRQIEKEKDGQKVVLKKVIFRVAKSASAKSEVSEIAG